MVQNIKAIYVKGALIPKTPCNLPEGAEVELTISDPHVLLPTVTDPEDRRRLMEELIENMRNNPIPEGAPRRFSREELHERR
jgi:predicted DNA-binding antitoxin AbrB/MazE fold protein